MSKLTIHTDKLYYHFPEPKETFNVPIDQNLLKFCQDEVKKYKDDPDLAEDIRAHLEFVQENQGSTYAVKLRAQEDNTIIFKLSDGTTVKVVDADTAFMVEDTESPFGYFNEWGLTALELGLPAFDPEDTEIEEVL